jgi:hypothetical protein
MEINDIEIAVKELIEFWKLQKIISPGNTLDEIRHFENSKSVRLPEDFKRYFLLTNAMVEIFPTYFDDNGFLFYSLQALETLDEWLGISQASGSENCLIFADYMNRSWSYGVKFSNFSENYEIVIITSSTKVVTHSLSAFIRLYLDNSPLLYDYK